MAARASRVLQQHALARAALFLRWRIAQCHADGLGNVATSAFGMWSEAIRDGVLAMHAATGLPNLSNATLFGTQMGGPRHQRVRAVDFTCKAPSAAAYLSQVEQACVWLAERKPDIVLYNAGMDCHIDDPLATLKLTTATIRKRDRFTFQFWRERKVPVLFCLAGGYQMPFETLAALHAVTWQEAAVKP